ncbi:YoaK family protein [Vibrio hannami]|uniref:YoaK family protein n=1 Tax=Vibrio hannami TaxID=2717094 RepID=UPI00240F6D81|nr:YoaK family protein [Vibrio hannami]MDG3087972.1 YoaK family protein [Vibrio hannami]
MISKLPKWVEYGAFILAFIAGNINVIGLLGFEHQAVSHISGTVTLVGSSLFESSYTHTFHLLGVLLAFYLGASVPGYLVHGTTLKLGKHYDTVLFAEAILIFVAFYLLSSGSQLGHFAASAACGMQNGLATTYSGAIVRTTHLTGIFTDLGLMLGARLRGNKFDKRKAILFLFIICGFVSGSVLGAFLYKTLQFKALLVPAIFCLVIATIYRTYFKKMNKKVLASSC